ncbi:MAG: AAA family ATPase [Gammaproteobacteria bacterium]|nr:AAA family ATPase [Gammaproteobacteria bacterium]MCP4981849.1 AAA family ATPase [Gammaproteobacteria bacterium]
MQFSFENYRLDTVNAALWNGDQQIEMRPKTFDVLRYLVEHAGELVRKETLLEAIWPNSYVVEGVLTTSMSELRKVFGDTAKNQRFIATVYRRGYRFIAVVEQGDGQAPVTEVGPEGSPQVSPPARSIHKFPHQRGFVGREQECERLVGLLANHGDCRILTLIGPGGIGKTRLALTLMNLLSELESHPFEDGFCAVGLQSLDSNDDIFSAIAEALELQYSGGDSLQVHIQNYLECKRILLLLDNFEHLLQHSDALGEMVAKAPGLKLLVTSRESLPIADAWFHPVNGLEYVDAVESEAIDLDAVRMFAQIAHRNQPEFDVQEKLPAVLRICEMVEGMPLALELAASWLKMLSMDEIADEIEKGIDILADQYGSENDRHSSVRAIFIETWQRLTESERSLLKQFSIFRGGADRSAISAIIGAGLPMLVRLVNRALLRTTYQLRYRMHELIRQFAEEELAADPATEFEARHKHAQYYIGGLGDELERLRSSQQGEACREIQANIDNIRAAWRWAVVECQVDLLSGAIRSLSLFCDFRGLFQDGLTMFAAAQTMIEASDHEEKNRLVEQIKVRSAILNFRLSRYDTALGLFLPILRTTTQDYERCLILRFLGDYHFSHAGHCSAEQTRSYLDKCIGLCLKLGDIHLQTECMCELAIHYTNMIVDVETSREYAIGAVELARRTGRPDLLAISLDVLAWTTNHRGDYRTAEKLWREVFDLSYESGNRGNEALAMNWLGWSAWSVGGKRHDEAIKYFSDALKRYEDLGDRANVAMTSADLATVLMEQGDLETARKHCQRGLSMASEIGRGDHYVYNLYVQGAIECAAANLVAAREHLQQSLQLAWEQEEQTNKPVVIYYVAQLLYAEYQASPDLRDAGMLEKIGTLMLFLQYYPPTWQAFKDRALKLQATIEADHKVDPFADLKSKPGSEIIESVLESIPTLLN